MPDGPRQVVVQHVARGGGTVGEVAVRDVTHDADDPLALPVEGQERTAERILPGQELRREGLIDDHHRLTALPVRGIEASPPQHRNAHRLEVIAAHHAEEGRGLRHGGPALDGDAPVVASAAQRQLVRRRDGGHAWQRPQRRHHVEDCASALGPGKPRRHRGIHDNDVTRVESRIDRAEVRDAADQQTGASGEQHGQRHLRDHQTAFEPAAAPGDAAGPRRGHGRLQAAAAPERQARHDGDEHRRDEGRQHGRPEDRPVEAGALGERPQRERLHEHRKAGGCQNGAEETSQDPDHHGFEHELLDEPLLVRAERGAHRHLRRPRVHLAEHQRRHVRARNQQDHPHRGKRRDQARADVAHEVFASRRDVGILRQSHSGMYVKRSPSDRAIAPRRPSM